MNLKELSFEKQVSSLRSLMSGGENSFLSHFALFAFRHHLATKHSPDFSQKPVLRWYLGQLAKEYISKYVKEAKESLENFAEIGLLETGGESNDKEYRLNEAVYPALCDVLAEIFGEERISKEISRARYFKNRAKEVKE